MSFDMSQFHQVFFEEAEEHLAEMERLLVAVDLAAPDIEDLNAIFRAAHSIKGGAGTFGFEDIAAFTHTLESLLDRARRREIVLTAAMVDAFLRAKDVLRMLLSGHRDHIAVDPAEVAAVSSALEVFTGETAAVVVAAPVPAVEVAAAPATPARLCCTVWLKVPLETPGVHVMAEELRRAGKVEIRSESRTTIIEFEGQLGESEIADYCEFVAGRGRYRIESRADERALQVDSPGASDAVEGDGWGLFEAPAPAVVADAVEGDGWGLFAAPESADPPASTGVQGDGWGLFEAPAPAEDPAPASGAVEGDGWGLFAGAAGTTHAGKSGQAHAPAAPTAATPAAQPAVQDSGARGAPRREGGQAGADASIRVSVEKVDQLINLVGELVITQAMLAQSASGMDQALHEKLVAGLTQLERNTRDLQESVMSIRMMPIAFVFSRFPRVVRDLSSQLGKEVELVTEGETTELDKGLVEKIADPLTHLVRNSLDHGIETAEARVAAGKPAKGRIALRAFHQGGSIVIEVSDDGAGLNRERILAKAKERGMDVHDGMSDEEVWQLIFEAGFSTAQNVTSISGRGVGMDVVKRNISAIGGRVEIDSTVGMGTCITIRLPLTLAILDGMSVKVAGEVFIVPLGCVVESLQPEARDFRSVGGRARVVQVRDDYLPVISMHDVFELADDAARADGAILLVVESDVGKIALPVDELLGQHQVVIKSLETNYRRVHGISGATIMGDGRVALILDVAALVRMSQGSGRRMAA